MKKLIAILLTVTMLVPMLTAFSTFGVAAEGAVYDKPSHADVTDASAGLTFTGTMDNNRDCADYAYNSKTRLESVPHTFQAWVYIPEAYKSQNCGTVISNYATKDDTWGSYLYMGVVENRVPLITYYNDHLVDHEIKFTKSAIPVEKWTMLTVVWDGATGYVSCYLDGKLSEQAYFLPDLDANVIESPMALGGDYRTSNTNYFRGGLQDVSMYATARTAEQVQADYERGVNVNDTDLLCHYDMDANDLGQNIPDASGNGYTMQYCQTWLTEAEMEQIRATYTFEPAYSFVAIGDTQKTTYRDAITYGITTPTAENSTTYRMYQWLANNKTAKNIQMVMGMGDITDANLEPEWKLMKQAVAQMDAAGVRYSLIRGNHDSYTSQNAGYTGLGDNGFDTYFGKGTAYYDQVAANGGFYDSNSVRNTYHLVDVGETKWLIIGIDYRASDAVLNWAGNLCETYADRKVIITTHIYLNADGDPISFGHLSDSPNNGDDKWNKLAAKYANVEMVLSGHIGSDRLVTTQVKGNNGNTVTQMLIDSQSTDGALGGIGFVALYRFNAEGTAFYTEYYSTERDRYFLGYNQFYVDLEAEGEELTATKWDLQRGRKPSGSGTAADPYLISHPEHLAWIAYQVENNDHHVHFTNTYFKQTCDIDLQGSVIQSIGGYFKTTTGAASALNAKTFGGIYDGGGYVIKNGTITPCHPDQYFNKRKCFGLFGIIYGATIKNVVLEDVCVVGRGSTGAIVGKAMAPFDGSANVGFNRIIGCRVGEGVEIRTWHPFPTNDSAYDGSSKMGVGSICGIAYAAEIRGCSAANTITLSGLYGMIGGIAGTAGYNTLIDHCAFTGGIELVDTKYCASVSIGGMTGCYSPHSGSIVDEDKNIAPMKGFLRITNCYNSGSYVYTGDVAIDVVNRDQGYNVNNKNIHWGGMIGHAGSMMEIGAADGVPYLIENCYNLYSEQRGPLEQSAARYVSGGIVGRSVASNSVSQPFWLKNCYSVEVDARGLDGKMSTNLYRCDTHGVTSKGLPAVQVMPGSTVETRTLEQMRHDVTQIDVGIVRIQEGMEGMNTTWRFGSGLSATNINAGDLYLDTDTGDVYMYLERTINMVYSDSPWVFVCNIKGEDGADGKNGQNGKDGKDGASGKNGSMWHTGTGTPNVKNAVANDMYLNTETGVVYRYNGAIWVPVGNLTGPQGEPGADAGISGGVNTPGGGDVSLDQDAVSTDEDNTLAVAALIVAAVVLVGNAVFIVIYFVGKKKKREEW